MTATDELRALLDERGVEHYDRYDVTEWVADDGEICHTSEINSNGASVMVLRKCTTPQQAIDATLGDTDATDARQHDGTLGSSNCTDGERTNVTCHRLPADNYGTTCIVRKHGYEMEFGYWKCSECGANCFEGARYCMNCGRKVVEPTTNDVDAEVDE